MLIWLCENKETKPNKKLRLSTCSKILPIFNPAQSLAKNVSCNYEKMEKEIIFVIIIFIIPVSILLIINWVKYYKKFKDNSAGKILGIIWLIVIIVILITPYFKPKIVTEKDIIGDYVVDTLKYSKKQAKWQYEHFKFKITNDRKLIFQILENDKTVKTEILKISYNKSYRNNRVIIHSDSINHHIIRKSPTLYRKKYNKFYYVFESEKFGNVFFKKEK